MAAPDMDVIKEIPGYKVILKAVLKSQIQQLVEQLAMHTEEESIILTASISDGTLSHLGSDSGKSFLDDYEDVKSQFLGFCLKHHHKKKQKEKEREELERQRQMMPTTPTRFTPRTPRYASPRGPQFSPRFSPRQPSFTVRSPNARHAPYPVSRPMKGPSLNLNRQDQTASGNQGAMKLPLNNQVIKIEPDEDGSNSNTGDALKQTESSSSQPGSPSHTPSAPVKSDSTEDNDKSNSSSSTIPTEASDLKHSDTQPAEGLSLDSDLSSLISGDQSESGPSTSAGQPAEHDPNVSVKVEAISESEMELEITGVEPGRASVSSQDTSWAQNTSMGYESGASGNQADLQTQEGYNVIEYVKEEVEEPEMETTDWKVRRSIEQQETREITPVSGAYDQRKGQMIWTVQKLTQPNKFKCVFCDYVGPNNTKLARHIRTHTGEKPFACKACGYSANRTDTLKRHMLSKHGGLL